MDKNKSIAGGTLPSRTALILALLLRRGAFAALARHCVKGKPLRRR
jgi:hypothetical protein